MADHAFTSGNNIDEDDCLLRIPHFEDSDSDYASEGSQALFELEDLELEDLSDIEDPGTPIPRINEDYLAEYIGAVVELIAKFIAVRATGVMIESNELIDGTACTMVLMQEEDGYYLVRGSGGGEVKVEKSVSVVLQTSSTASTIAMVRRRSQATVMIPAEWALVDITGMVVNANTMTVQKVMRARPGSRESRLHQLCDRTNGSNSVAS